MKVEGGKDILALIIDKDTTHAQRLQQELVAQDFDSESTFLAEEARALIKGADVVMIDPHDLTIGVKEIKQLRDVPVLVLSHDAKDARLAAYADGADIYIVKPSTQIQPASNLYPHLVASHARAILRRYQEDKFFPPAVLEYTDLNIVIDIKTRTVLKDEMPIPLAPVSQNLLGVLAENVGRVLNFRELLTKYKGSAYSDERENLRVDVSRLRSQLRPYDELVQTVSGCGYLLPNPHELSLYKDEVIFDEQGLVVTERGRIRFNNQPIGLTTSVRRTLLMLAMYAGSPVPFEAFLEKRQRFAIQSRIRRLREIFGDTNQTLIRTIPGEGYELGTG